MAKEKTSEEQPQALARTSPLLALRALAVEQWLLQTNARLQIRSALAANMQGYVAEFQKRITARQSWVRDRLAAQRPSSEGTQTLGQPQSMVSGIIERLAQEKKLSPQALNSELSRLGQPPLSFSEAQGHITAYLQRA